MTNAADNHAGRPPCTATSLTVPFTARCPIDPPGNRQGRDHEGVGAEGQAVAVREGQRRRIRERAVVGADEGIEEDSVNKGGRGLAAGSVGHRDDLVGEPRTAAAERRDAVEHRSFTGGVGRCVNHAGHRRR